MSPSDSTCLLKNLKSATQWRDVISDSQQYREITEKNNKAVFEQEQIERESLRRQANQVLELLERDADMLRAEVPWMADKSDDEIREKAQRTFSFFDDDGSGKISIAELAKALESLGLVLPEQEMRELVADMDTDGDGEISLEEFQSMVLKTLRGFIDGDGDATGSQHLQEYERRYMQVGPCNNEYNP